MMNGSFRKLERDAAGWPKWPLVASPDEVATAMREVLCGRVWTARASGMSPSITELVEVEIEALFGVRHALLVSSGTTAVELAVRALKLPEGSKVIVPALGWFATAAAVVRAGATPVFADVELATSCVDPRAVERCIDSDVRAIIAVHLHCAAAELDGLCRIAEQHSLALIEDCAQAHGAQYRGRPVGGFGHIGCFSFNQEKLIAIGEGGCVVTNDTELYERLYALRTDGYLNRQAVGRSFVPHGSIRGGNACASEFAAVIARAQLREFEALNSIRRGVATALDRSIAGIEGVTPLRSSPGTSLRSWHEYAFRLDLDSFGGWPVEHCGEFLERDLAFPIHQTDEPTQECPMLQIAASDTQEVAPVATQLHKTLLVLHHRILLDERIVDKLPEALERLRAAATTPR